MLIENLIDDAQCIEVLAYVAYCEGRDEQIIHNDRLYKHVIFAKQVAMSNFNIFIEANQLKNQWKSEPKLVSDFMNSYQLSS